MSVLPRDRTLIRMIMTDIIMKIDHSKILKEMMRNSPLEYEIFLSKWVEFVTHGTNFLVQPTDQNRELAFDFARIILNSPVTSYSLKELFTLVENKDKLIEEEIKFISENYTPYLIITENEN